ncbi:MAG: hypothetical protein AB7F86_17055 [Bdellovibrionales bacterium]
MKTLGFILVFLVSNGAFAREVREEFNTRTQLSTATAVWNQALGKVHPTPEVISFKAGYSPKSLDVGDGSHGSFNSSRYAEFSQNGDISGNKIRLDTSVYPELKVTDFTLDEGWTLEPVGSAPLIIRSLTTVVIKGEIHCEGVAGSDASGSTGGSGGAGRCGGAAGGTGGDTGGDASNGGDSTAPVTGGQGGKNNNPAVGGGGGGSWNTTTLAADGSNSSALLGGLKGTSSSDPEFTNIVAGSAGSGGGGGGGGGGGTTGAGGGGGGGGGTVIIHSVGNFDLGSATNANIGFIYANGGNGGDPTGNGGAGAGGGGGSIQVFSGGKINIYSNTGVGASQAVGGRNPAPTTGASGGIGRSWYSSVTYNGVGFYDPSEQAPVSAGNVRFNPNSEQVESKVYDLGSSKLSVLSISAIPTSTDFTVTFAGSTDGFVSDDSGWTNDVSQLTNRRYVKFRAAIATTNTASPTMIESISILYVPETETRLAFKAAGCGRISAAGNGLNGGGRHGLGAILLILPILLLFGFRRAFLF